MNHEAKEAAKLLSYLSTCNFGYEQIVGYRLDWHHLRQLSNEYKIDSTFIDEINRHLYSENLFLSNQSDFLVVDKIDRLYGIRKLTKRIIKDHFSF